MTRHDWTTETARFASNLLAVYSHASKADIDAGKRWYPAARRYAQSLARKYDVMLDIAAGVIAALSPGQEWTRNKQSADEFFRAWRTCQSCARERLDLATYGNGPVSKAYAIANGAPIGPTLHGPKTTAFYRAILDPTSDKDVVIDGHAKSAALGVRFGNHDGWTDAHGKGHKSLNAPGIKVERNEYPHLETAFRAAASIVGLNVNAFQAIVWIVWKRFPTGYTIQTRLAA